MVLQPTVPGISIANTTLPARPKWLVFYKASLLFNMLITPPITNVSVGLGHEVKHLWQCYFKHKHVADRRSRQLTVLMNVFMAILFSFVLLFVL